MFSLFKNSWTHFAELTHTSRLFSVDGHIKKRKDQIDEWIAKKSLQISHYEHFSQNVVWIDSEFFII